MFSLHQATYIKRKSFLIL